MERTKEAEKYESDKVRNDFDAKVINFILRRKCPADYNGYRYIVEGVRQIIEEDVVGCIHKSIYQELASRYRTETANIERCIRTICTKWWNLNRCGGLFEKRPSNRKFLCTLTEYVKLEDLGINIDKIVAGE